MADGEFTVTGVAEMNRRILNIMRGTPAEAAHAGIEVAKKTLAVAVELCPYDTHDLQNSGTVKEAEFSGYEVHVPIVFGEGLDYALVVHEDLEAHHPHGQAKFLETAVNRRAPTGAADLAREFRLERLVNG